MDSQEVTYYTEISLMMFGFGDSHKPNPETVRTVESIVLSQLRTIISEATKYTTGKQLRGEELVFLMRKNTWKMRRFVKHLQAKVSVSTVNVVVIDDDTKPKNPLLQFIAKIDETGELMDTNEFDEVKHRRLERANRISEALDEKKYLEFQKARCVSFSSGPLARSLEKLKLWLDPKGELSYTKYALEVLAYYAYETVAQITDYALLVRMDAKRSTDPLRSISGNCFTASMFNGEHRFSESKPDIFRVYSGQPPISVNEIKEVMRRVTMPQTGRLTFGTKSSKTQYILAL